MNQGGVPDLRRSAVIGAPDTFKTVVLEGALVSNGMPNFGKEISPKEAEAIRAYLIKRANDLRRDIADGTEPPK